MPKVSVIMGIYNTNDYNMISLSISSILNQTFKDFELIICDDGSTDNTYDVIDEIIKNDPRCTMIKNVKNLGLANSLNNCLTISSGEYIARMDADDISLPTRLEEEVYFLDNNLEYALVSGHAELFDENGVYGVRKYKPYPEKEDMLFGPPFIHAAVMIRKTALDQVKGYRICKETLRAEDYDLWMRLYFNNVKGHNLQKVIYKIREDKNAYKRRAYKFRFDEARIRYNGFKMLGLLPKGLLYVVKPLIVGLFPQNLLRYLRNECKS